MTNKRAVLSDESIYDFADEFLVSCPRCAEQAVVRDRGSGVDPRIRLSCAGCGHSDELRRGPSAIVFSSLDVGEEGTALVGAPVDWHFRQPLWLQTACCGETLWAYNVRHLEAIREFVAADLRERRRTEWGWRNQSLRSRLPKWVQLAKNREAVLRCLDRMHARVSAPAG
jgi:hypothetical protein